MSTFLCAVFLLSGFAMLGASGKAEFVGLGFVIMAAVYRIVIAIDGEE